MVHLLLAVVLTLFLAFQVRSLAFVLRSRRAVTAGRRRRRSDIVWAAIPVVVVLALAARSWVAVADLGRPAAAASAQARQAANPVR